MTTAPTTTYGAAEMAPGRASANPDEGQSRLFVTLWVMAFSAHYFESQPFDSWPVLLAGVPCLIFPGSAAAFAAFVIVGSGVVAIHLPAASNHLMLALVVHLVLAASAGVAMLAGNKFWGAGFLPAWIRQATVPAVLTLLVVYFFGAFHKLNTSFFDASVSCSGRLLYQGLRLQGLTVGTIPAAPILASAVATVMVEALILVLIAVPRTRRWGVLVGVGFHFLLAWAKFYDFSTFAFALYVLVLPTESPNLVSQMERWRRVGIAGWVLFALVSVSAYISGERVSPVGLTWHTLQAVTWALAVGPIILPLLRVNIREAPEPWAWRLRPAWLLIFPVLAFVNGAAPYLGLKTVASYSMFSNLRTEEDRTNHFFSMVESLRITGATTDTVDVLEIRLPAEPRLGWFERARGGIYWFKRQIRWANRDVPVRVPWLELRRAGHLFKDGGIDGVFVSYMHDGDRRQTFDAASDPELTAPLPFLSKHLQAFREIERGNRPVACRW